MPPVKNRRDDECDAAQRLEQHIIQLDTTSVLNRNIEDTEKPGGDIQSGMFDYQNMQVMHPSLYSLDETRSSLQIQLV